MKKAILTVAAIIFTATAASATPIALNPDAVLGTSFGNTGVFDQLGIYAETTSTDYGNNNLFADVGDVAVTSLIASTPVGTAGLGSSWYLVGGWADLQGFNPSPGQYVYTSGTLNLYATQTPYNFNSVELGANDDAVISGIQVASLSLVNGSGFLLPNPFENPNDPTDDFYGSINLGWTFTSIADGFWLSDQGKALSLHDLNNAQNLTIADANTDRVFVTTVGNDTVIYSDHNGSVEVGVVPEPATMALFGSGLLGLAGAGIRKKFAV